MNGFRICHRHFSFAVDLPENLAHLDKSSFLISKIPLRSLYARIVVSSSGDHAKHVTVRLRKTPHLRFIEGNRHEYHEYLKRHGRNVGYGAEHSMEQFEKIISTQVGYLEPPFASKYIICEMVKTFFGERLVILDGVHRACQLLFQGVDFIPVAILQEGKTSKQAQFNRYLADYKDDFLEWYTPLEIGSEVIHERTYPHFKERPEYLENRERGRSKWEFIIEKNLPDLRGKRICDIGCNCGLYSIYMLQLGAKQVTGYDRNASSIQPTNSELPLQNVVEQAYFVRNLFCLSGMTNLSRLDFKECDLNTLDFTSLQYDVFFSCCVLYHFGERFEEAIRSIHNRIPIVFLQTNLGHKNSPLAKYASIEYHKTLLEKYGYSVRVDAPENYAYPIIMGRKSL